MVVYPVGTKLWNGVTTWVIAEILQGEAPTIEQEQPLYLIKAEPEGWSGIVNNKTIEDFMTAYQVKLKYENMEARIEELEKVVADGFWLYEDNYQGNSPIVLKNKPDLSQMNEWTYRLTHYIFKDGEWVEE